MSLLLPLLILAACGISLLDWRKGIWAAIAVGLLQDPLRKMMPGSPGYFALSTIPVWMTVFVVALSTGVVHPGQFLARFPRLGRTLKLFGAFLVLPAILSITYGQGTWKVAALGAVIYSATFFMLCCGWRCAPDARTLRRGLAFYALAASVLLIGGLLDHWGWSGRYAAIGTEALGHVWVTHRTGEAVYMLAGFFRGPDVMGWHAALVLMVAITLSVRARGAARWAWFAVAIWGLVNVWLCGRRKMIAMLPVFIGVYLLEIAWFQDLRRWVLAVAATVLALGLGLYVASQYLQSDPVQRFYITAFHDAEEQVWQHGVESVWETLRQAGFWGYGLGMGQQGVHHIGADMPRTWQESGPTKLVAELGVPGLILFLAVLAQFALTAFHVLRRIAPTEEFMIGAGIIAIMVANLSAGMVSAQVYGDPFIAALLGLLAGMFFATADHGTARPSEPPCPP